MRRADPVISRREETVAKHLVDRLSRLVDTVLSLLKPNDVARLLAVSRAWVYEAAKSGRIPSVRIGGPDGPLRFVPEDIERWLAETRAGWLPGGNDRAVDGRAGAGDDPAAETLEARSASRRPRQVGQEPLF
jgi:excisionase family DNA binding protein